MKRVLVSILVSLTLLPVLAQQARWEKLSPMLRQMVRQQARSEEAAARLQNSMTFEKYSMSIFQNSMSIFQNSAPPVPEVCAFMRIAGSSAQVLADNGCRDLASVGDIHIASIPVNRLASLSLDPRVLRMEARPTGQLLLDTVARCINAEPVYAGTALPQAYTGRGVVVGLMDIGFDLTHPTFRNADATPRIRRFWDMLSNDTVGSSLFVGRDYVTSEEILALGHSRDGLDQTHGTHTAGIAAGNGYDSHYRGLAPESDICLVANAVSDNASLIDSALLSRFTFATDALGFKYLFDYARQNDQPCVVSFSEGSGQDFWGYDQLYYEMLDSLLGPGRILVVAAGNMGAVKSWFSKPSGQQSQGMFVKHGGEVMMLTLKSADKFLLRLVAYPDNAPADTLTVPLSSDLALGSHVIAGLDSVVVEAYPNCYDSLETCYDLVFYSTEKQIGTNIPLSVEVLDNQEEVTCWRVNGEWTTNAINPTLCAGESSHNIMSPASAPRIICVGATTHRDGIINLDGQWKYYWAGEPGSRISFSSVGPTMDGRIKPDVMAPGNNIISSYSSYYLENHPTATDISWDVSHFDYEGRTYAWNTNSGTSMACPVVAGVIALWLQAKPDLTPEDVMGVISRTSRRPDPSLSYPNNYYGYGEIDAYRGLLDILGIDGIEEVSHHHTPAQVRLRGRQLTISSPQNVSSDALQVRLFSLSGRQVLKTTVSLSDGRAVVMIPANLPAGVYAVQLDGSEATAGSTLIRLTD